MLWLGLVFGSLFGMALAFLIEQASRKRTPVQKYIKGDKVWYSSCGALYEAEVIDVSNGHYYVTYNGKRTTAKVSFERAEEAFALRDDS